MFEEMHKGKLKKYNEMWNRVKILIGNYFDIEAIYDGKYVATKINFCKDEIRTDFQDEGLPTGKTP